jgi:hypothetical protein
MNKATIGLLVSLGVWAAGAIALRADTRKAALALEKEINEELVRKAPEFKGSAVVEATASFSYKVKITLFRADGTEYSNLETEHSRYIGWFQASTWLARQIRDLTAEA